MGRRAAVGFAAVLAAATFAAPGRAAGPATPVVPSVEPAATAKLWKQLVAHPYRAYSPLQAGCRPLRGIFYAQTDWLRLATKLAAQASPCAQYYISVPPLAANKTSLRAGEAAKIRALGPNFHALAEISYTGWNAWVAANGETWFDAGVEARKRMEAAGYDVSKGDLWAVNELSSAVRVGTGTARQNVRDLVRGLATGSGGDPVKGVVWIIGVAQSVLDTTLYQTNLQNWFGDTGFWADMSAYVADWSQEVYGDWRRVAVAGAGPQTRRDYLNDYLQHELLLARAAPPAIEPARTFVQSAYAPLASAAWAYESAYGWSSIPFDQMESFVSNEVYALRSFSVAGGQPQDHWGFAWAPRNPPGLPRADFVSQSAAILDRLAAAIRDSAALSNPSDPGIEACTGSCTGDQPGASFTEVWKSFRTWTQPLLTITTPPQTLAAGQASGPITVGLFNATGAAQPAQAPLTVTLTAASPRGQFSLSQAGPFTPTLTLSIPAGATSTGPFYYVDTRAGSETITASAPGVTSGTQSETVLPGSPVSMTVTTTARTVAAGGTATLTAAGLDQYGNAVPVSAAWTVDPAGLGTIRPAIGPSVTFTAGPKGGRGIVTATGSGFTASTPLIVLPGVVRVSRIRYGVGAGKSLLVTAYLVDSRGRPVPDAFLSLVVRRRGYGYFAGHGTTLANGRTTFRMRHKPGCYRTTVTRLNANGYRWDRRTPDNRFCK
ncbi:MAG TPA: hypothetical protein VFB35_03650 [Gaiellaceae bacterium]|nr:hypothetical protein [Gaiellaceae bacterium]